MRPMNLNQLGAAKLIKWINSDFLAGGYGDERYYSQWAGHYNARRNNCGFNFFYRDSTSLNVVLTGTDRCFISVYVQRGYRIEIFFHSMAEFTDANWKGFSAFQAGYGRALGVGKQNVYVTGLRPVVDKLNGRRLEEEDKKEFVLSLEFTVDDDVSDEQLAAMGAKSTDFIKSYDFPEGMKVKSVKTEVGYGPDRNPQEVEYEMKKKREVKDEERAATATDLTPLYVVIGILCGMGATIMGLCVYRKIEQKTNKMKQNVVVSDCQSDNSDPKELVKNIPIVAGEGSV